jgi:hypothetical protein
MTISLFHLRGPIAHAIIPNAPLDKEQGRWTRHPQAVTLKDIVTPISPYTGAVRGYIQVHFTVFGGMDREPKKTPPLCLVLEALSCGYPVHLDFFKSRTLIMLYTFVIAYRDQKLSQLARIRTVSTIAQDEPSARAQLQGLPLVFVRRTSATHTIPAAGGAL